MVVCLVASACASGTAGGSAVTSSGAALDIIPLTSTSSSTSASSSTSTATSSSTSASTPSATDAFVGPGLAVDGTQLVDAHKRPVRLVGVNRFGAEYPCAQGWGIFDRPADDDVAAGIASWHVNSVRVLLNEHCWLGLADVLPALGGENYRKAIVEWVDRLNRHGLVVVLSLAWSASADRRALSQAPMANADHSESFWRSVAAEFATRPYVLFDLYSEPHDVTWVCWQQGCTVDGVRYVGMQSLVDAVRSVDSVRPLILSGINYGNDLSGWLAHAPVDPAHALVAGFHVYNFNRCNGHSCWQSTAGTVARSVPVVASEFGEDTCGTKFTTSFMNWADSTGISYLAWAWAPWERCQGPSLVIDDAGTPTTFGRGVRDHIAALGGTPGPGATPTTVP